MRAETRFIIASGFFIVISPSSTHVRMDFKTLVMVHGAQAAALEFLFVPVRKIVYPIVPRRPESHAMTLFHDGPSLSVPIFDGGRLKSTLELREIQQQEGAVEYHRTVLRAWHGVVDALVAYRKEQQRRVRLVLQVEHSCNALSPSRARHEAGVTDFLSVLDAERTLLQAEPGECTKHYECFDEFDPALQDPRRRMGGSFSGRGDRSSGRKTPS